MTSPAADRISRDDIEAKFRELQGEVEIISDEAINYAVVAGAAVLVGVVVVAFWLGRRRGRRARTVVEIRRV
ncbi:MAG: hypothetical protein U0Q07_02790 [Acidimicrobiales bacterium]